MKCERCPCPHPASAGLVPNHNPDIYSAITTCTCPCHAAAREVVEKACLWDGDPQTRHLLIFGPTDALLAAMRKPEGKASDG